ncbi:50S ribosomal protein L11 methyltransferase [Elioraea thermophila]|uniref:50S ribosomal protein L11 methyltransferase n=1 Tax=Elioraea thermophila TaxID=2185104 RepID=UPI000DF1AB95|nr:50S ribosomal protein L11 methyltransferase [Elioraea thermophila]
MRRFARLSVSVPEAAVPAFVAAFESVCDSVEFVREDESCARWAVSGLLREASRRAELDAALALAAAAAGVAVPEVAEGEVEADGWLARSLASFPPLPIGRRFLIRGTHDAHVTSPGRLALTIDAGLAFGSGEHATTRGCLIALERLRRPQGPVADIGTGSGVLALAAAGLWRVPVVGVELEPWAAHTAAQNAKANGLARFVRVVRGDGWHAPAIRRRAPYAVAFANILARPLCAMARHAARRVARCGRLILSGFHPAQARMVVAAHRRVGFVLVRRYEVETWTTLVLAKR